MLKTNANLRCFRDILKPYLPSLYPTTMNTASHKRQFPKHCKCQKQGPQTSHEHDRVGPRATFSGKLKTVQKQWSILFQKALDVVR